MLGMHDSQVFFQFFFKLYTNTNASAHFWTLQQKCISTFTEKTMFETNIFLEQNPML